MTHEELLEQARTQFTEAAEAEREIRSTMV